MRTYANLHTHLEQMRIRARRAARGAPPVPGDVRGTPEPTNSIEPPRVLILGPESSGKTTATKILTNYAVRGPLQFTPMVVNLDPSEVIYNISYMTYHSLFSLVGVGVGWVDYPRDSVSVRYRYPASHVHSGKPPGHDLNFSSDHFVNFWLSTSRLLVRASRLEAQPPSC